MYRLQLLYLALLLAGCPQPTGTGDAYDVAQQRGKLVVALDAGYDPFEVINADGTLSGYDVDLLAEVAQDLGVALELKNVAWDGIIAELRTGRADCIFSGMSVTDERKQVVDFSTPYFSIGQVVVKRSGDDRIQSWQDLNAAGWTIATQQATTGEQAIRTHMPQATLLRFPKADAACLALIQGKADAVVFDHPFLMKYVATRTSGELEGIWEPFTREDIAAAIRKDSPKLRAAINATLARLQASGKLAQLQQKHFGAALVSGAGGAPAPADASPPGE